MVLRPVPAHALPSESMPRLYAASSGLLAFAGGAILVGPMLLAATDAMARHVFGAPVRGAFELAELALAVRIVAGLVHVVHRVRPPTPRDDLDGTVDLKGFVEQFWFRPPR